MVEKNDERSSTLRVLIVDDDAGVRKFMQRLLSSAGLEAEVCGCPVEAIERLRKDPVDVVVTDLVMPKLSGLDLIDELRGVLRPSTRYFVISGQPRHADTPRDVQWLEKPVDLDALLDALER